MTTTTSTHSPAVDRKVVVITGASSGIGEATALHLAVQGHHVVAAARRTDRLDDLQRRASEAAEASGGSLVTAQVDVTVESDVTHLIESTRDRFGRVDVVFANAGVMPLSRLDSLLVQEWQRMVDVNVVGLLHTIAAALPVFEQQRRGLFITTASIGAHQVVPTSAVYSGTKYAAWAITEGLRLESPPYIRVSTITPGVVESELASTITEPGAAEAMKTYRAASISPFAIARAVSYVIGEDEDVDVNEIVVRPTRQR
ncbi:SDR family oxidoreductase [Aeromicrobium chenweiae]|uniref:Oxidoreductase n=1 Tax=Aeromicrobium chenweiae TaxID=2079793 RepID=A0A2S0WHG7_9ACTN|nr:SDR family oxidoreductase [Aeromicrobium chenweiae]AWB90796.1 oxidoreductase [Aeromicrobium chenweiae]TGN31059.1 SDR family oxidoreductase [Aeromicrobium chenweiae]